MWILDRGGLAQRLALARLQATRAVALAPDTVITALCGAYVLLSHRLRVGRGRRSIFTVRPLEERGAAARWRAAATAAAATRPRDGAETAAPPPERRAA